MKSVDHAVKFLLANAILIILSFNALANQTDQNDPPILLIGAQNSNNNNQPLSVTNSAASGMLSTTSASFVRFFRYPIEPPTGYLTMDEIEPAPTPTAYYRDVYVGAETIISVSGPVASETWRVDWQLPNGSIMQSTLQFFSTYNGKENCFVGNQIVCGTTTVLVYWYIPARCQPSGAYTVTFYDNGSQYDQRQFKLLPQIKEGKVPSYHQYDPIWESQPMGLVYSPNLFPPRVFVRYPIRAKGCALTSTAMILSYHGVTGSDGSPIKPDELNEKLLYNLGYSLSGDIIWSRIARITGGKVNFVPELTFDNLEHNICEYGPQLVGAVGSNETPNSHWMVATGLNTEQQFIAQDPSLRGDTYYGQSWKPSNSTRGLVGPGYIVTDPSGISIYLHSPAELLLTDPQGRKLGIDPSTDQYFKEIPQSYYELNALTDQDTGFTDEPSKELTFAKPIEGEYNLEVIGTGTGDYALELQATDSSLEPSSALVEQVPITPNERHSYRFYFSGTANAPVEFIANFKGSGQNTNVNSLLTYNAPVESQTRLPAGTDSYTTSVFYGRKIIPQSFHAEFNGTDISSLFHPIPGTNERVKLPPLISGRNLLHLTINGNINNKVSTDSDRLVFVVP